VSDILFGNPTSWIINENKLPIMNSRDKPITIPPDLVRDLWSAIKSARDATATARASEERLNALLKRMKDAGMADWIPTIDEVIAAGPYTLWEC